MGILQRITAMIKESDDEAHIRVGQEWMTMKEYRERYLKKPEVEQLELFPNLPVVSGNSIDEQFMEFHVANPHVYRNLVRLAREAKSQGCKKIGMKFLIERLRWEYIVKTNHAASEYAINNNYTSRYARMIMDTCPDLQGFFETRRLRERV